jgi:hypothetical protein
MKTISTKLFARVSLINTLTVAGTPLASGMMLVAFEAHGQTDAVYAWTNFVGQPGGRGNVDGTGSGVRFNGPYSVAVDTNGNVFVADTDNHTIRKVTPAGVVTTLAGSAGASGTNDVSGICISLKDEIEFGNLHLGSARLKKERPGS